MYPHTKTSIVLTLFLSMIVPGCASSQAAKKPPDEEPLTLNSSSSSPDSLLSSSSKSSGSSQSASPFDSNTRSPLVDTWPAPTPSGGQSSDTGSGQSEGPTTTHVSQSAPSIGPYKLGASVAACGLSKTTPTTAHPGSPSYDVDLKGKTFAGLRSISRGNLMFLNNVLTIITFSVPDCAAFESALEKKWGKSSWHTWSFSDGAEIVFNANAGPCEATLGKTKP